MFKRPLGGIISAAIIAAAAGSAHAATLVNGTGHLDEVVHANGAQSGNTVTGLTNPGGFYVDFTSTDTLTTTGNGVAQINGPFDYVTIAPTPPPSSNQGLVGFDAIQFSVPDHNNLSTGKQVNNQGDSFTIIANFLGGGSQTFNPTVYNNNKYEVIADTGQVISSVEIGGLTDPTYGAIQFGDVRQVSFNGAVPEPATWATMLVGFGAVGATIRRRRSLTRAALASDAVA